MPTSPSMEKHHGEAFEAMLRGTISIFYISHMRVEGGWGDGIQQVEPPFSRMATAATQVNNGGSEQSLILSHSLDPGKSYAGIVGY